MGNRFDDLFNEFFGDFLRRYSNNNDFQNYLRMISEGGLTPNGGENIMNDYNIDENKPDEVVYKEEHGMYVKVSFWRTPYGDVIKREFRDIPFDENEKRSTTINTDLDVTKLQIQLDKAIAEEKYEEAARLRDLITPPTPKKTRKPRTKKKKEGE